MDRRGRPTATAAGRGSASRASARFLLGLLAITLLGGALRLHQLGAASFWQDELYTIRTCAGLESIHRSKLLGYLPTACGLWACGVRPSDIPAEHPEQWRELGVTERAGRSGAALVGVLSIFWLGWASRHILGSTAALVFALLLAIAPWHISWSQASRFYSQQFLFYALALIWFFKATREQSRAGFAAAMVCVVLAFLTQPTALLIGLVFALDWTYGLASGRPLRLGVFGWVAAAVAVAICLVPLAADVSTEPDDWTQFAKRSYQTPLKLVLATVFMVTPTAVLFALLSAWQVRAERPRLTAYLLAAAIVPLLALAVMSMRSYVALRYALVCLYGWLALAAIGIEALDRVIRGRGGWGLRLAPLGLLLAPILLMDYAYFTSGHRLHPRWREAFDYVASRRGPNDAVMAHALFGKYYLEDANVLPLPKSAEDVAVLGRTVWIVVQADDVVRGRRRAWLDELAELKAYFNARVLAVHSSIHVYRYEASGPPGAAITGSQQAPTPARQPASSASSREP